MRYRFQLVRERCRLGIGPESEPVLQVVYALNQRLRVGSRSKLLLALRRELGNHSLELHALDMFDELIKIQVPIGADAEIFERALAHALESLEETAEHPFHPELEQNVQRYLNKSTLRTKPSS